MIASFKYSYIFLKVPKTGGTSVEIALSKFCGRDDIVTPLAFNDERSRIIDGRVLARNFSTDKDLVTSLRKAVLQDDEYTYIRLVKSLETSGQFHEHMAAVDVQRLLSANFWRAAFKFTIERHPYEKAYSMASYRLAQWGESNEHVNSPPRTPDNNRFEILLERIIEKNQCNNRNIYCLENDLAVDMVYKYELIETGFSDICHRIGIRNIPELPFAKSNFRIHKEAASTLLSDVQKQRIYKNCKQTFDELGYSC